MPIIYKGQIAYTLEEVRERAKLRIRERAKTIPTRLKEIRIQKGKNPTLVPSSSSMSHTDNPIQDIQEWFDNHLDIQYEKSRRTSQTDFRNL